MIRLDQLPLVDELLHLLNDVMGQLSVIEQDCNGDLNAYKEEYLNTIAKFKVRQDNLWAKIGALAAGNDPPTPMPEPEYRDDSEDEDEDSDETSEGDYIEVSPPPQVEVRPDDCIPAPMRRAVANDFMRALRENARRLNPDLPPYPSGNSTDDQQH